MHTQTNRRLTLSTGIRKGYYEQYSERDQEQFKQSAWTGQAGIVYEINDKWAPYLHWNNSFSPSMALDKDNRLLSPTTGQEWEAGIRYNPKSSIQITASVLILDARISMYPFGESPTTLPSEKSLHRDLNWKDGLSSMIICAFWDLIHTWIPE